MKVCAHYNLGPFDRSHIRANSAGNALVRFKVELEQFYGDLKGILERTGEDHVPGIALYPVCEDCTSNMCFHDYPMSVYQIGPRGGLRKVA